MKHIVVIEDDDTLRQGIELILQDRGYDAHTYSNNSEFSRQPLDYNPDLYLIDYRLPGADGLEITQQIRQHEKQPPKPIIILSAGGDNLPEKVKASQANLFIRKPFEVSFLLDVIEHFLLSS